MKLLKLIPAAAIALTALMPLKSNAENVSTQLYGSGDNTSGYKMSYSLYQTLTDGSVTKGPVHTQTNSGAESYGYRYQINNDASSYYWEYVINDGDSRACPTTTPNFNILSGKTEFIVRVNTSSGTICEKK